MGDQKNQGKKGRADQGQGEFDRSVRKPGEKMEDMSERASNPQKDTDGNRNRQSNPVRETGQPRDK